MSNFFKNVRLVLSTLKLKNIQNIDTLQDITCLIFWIVVVHQPIRDLEKIPDMKYPKAISRNLKIFGIAFFLGIFQNLYNIPDIIYPRIYPRFGKSFEKLIFAELREERIIFRIRLPQKSIRFLDHFTGIFIRRLTKNLDKFWIRFLRRDIPVLDNFLDIFYPKISRYVEPYGKVISVDFVPKNACSHHFPPCRP